jgi:hypothetical protein
MAGGGIMTDAQGNVMTDENGEVMVQKGLPYLVAYWSFTMEAEWWHLYWFEGIFLDEPTHCLQILLDDDEEYEAVGVYVNIHPWAYYANLYGDGFARPLNQEGDVFKLIIHGLNPDGTENGKSVEYIMAKFEDGQLIQSDKWKWVDLSSLGIIGGFYCTMETTDVNSMGPKSPMYFCMDKLQIRKYEISTHISVTNITNVPDSATVGVPLMLTGKVIPEDATYQTIIWSVFDAGTTSATITENTLHTTAEGTLIARATIVNGIAEGNDYTQDFTIYVTKPVGINENELSNVQIYSYQNTVYINNVGVRRALSLPPTVEIIDMTGRVVYRGAINDENAAIPLQVADGVYHVVLHGRDEACLVSTKVFITN